MHQPTDTVPADRRTKRRFQPTFGTTCRMTPSRQLGLVRDISAEGLGLLMAFPPALDEIVPVELATEIDSEHLSIRIRVAHVRPLSTGDYFVGARFVRPLVATEIEPFINPARG